MGFKEIWILLYFYGNAGCVEGFHIPALFVQNVA